MRYTIIRETWFTNDKAKELVDYLILETADTYTLEVEYKDFVGEFKAVITKAW